VQGSTFGEAEGLSFRLGITSAAGVGMGRGVIENKLSTEVESPPPSLRVCMSIGWGVIRLHLEPKGAQLECP